MLCIQLVWVIIKVNSNTLTILANAIWIILHLVCSYKRCYENSAVNCNKVTTYCASLHINLQDVSNGFAFLSLIKYSVLKTTEEFKSLNRANGVALGLGGLALQ